MTLQQVLRKIEKVKCVRRAAWPKGVYLDNSNGVLYIHSSPNDRIGRPYNPTLHDMTMNDWS